MHAHRGLLVMKSMVLGSRSYEAFHLHSLALQPARSLNQYIEPSQNSRDSPL